MTHRKVQERPYLPLVTPTRDVQTLTVFATGLTRQLVALFQEYGEAINHLMDEIEALEVDGADSFTDLNDVPNSFSGEGGKALAVNTAEDAIEFVTFPTADVEDFTDLDDTPGTYAGDAGKAVAVNSSEDGLEFVNFPGAGVDDFTDLGDTPGSYSGAAGLVPTVNAPENGMTFEDPLETPLEIEHASAWPALTFTSSPHALMDGQSWNNAAFRYAANFPDSGQTGAIFTIQGVSADQSLDPSEPDNWAQHNGLFVGTVNFREAEGFPRGTVGVDGRAVCGNGTVQSRAFGGFFRGETHENGDGDLHGAEIALLDKNENSVTPFTPEQINQKVALKVVNDGQITTAGISLERGGEGGEMGQDEGGFNFGIWISPASIEEGGCIRVPHNKPIIVTADVGDGAGDVVRHMSVNDSDELIIGAATQGSNLVRLASTVLLQNVNFRSVGRSATGGNTLNVAGVFDTDRRVAVTSSARVSRTTAQTIPNNSSTKLQFNSDDHDPDNLWDAGNNRFVMPADAVFAIVSVNVHWEGNDNGIRFVDLTGSRNLGRSRQFASGESEQSVTGQTPITSGQTVEAFVFQNSGAPRDVLGTGYTNMSITVFRT